MLDFTLKQGQETPISQNKSHLNHQGHQVHQEKKEIKDQIFI
jgi:hypothetical protein